MVFFFFLYTTRNVVKRFVTWNPIRPPRLRKMINRKENVILLTHQSRWGNLSLWKLHIILRYFHSIFRIHIFSSVHTVKLILLELAISDFWFLGKSLLDPFFFLFFFFEILWCDLLFPDFLLMKFHALLCSFYGDRSVNSLSSLHPDQLSTFLIR